MSNIEYEIQPNKLTTPLSYAARVRTRGTISRAQFALQIAHRGGLDVSSVLALWSLQHRILTENLRAGMNVEVDDLCIASLSLSGKLDGPTSPLPADAQLYVSLRADARLVEAVRVGASLTRIQPSNLAPQIVQVGALIGSLQTLQSDNAIQIEGYRQTFDATRPDEGVFLVPQDGTPAIRATNYLTQGDRKLIFAVPVLPSNTDFQLEIRARTKNSKATAPLYTGIWNILLHSA